MSARAIFAFLAIDLAFALGFALAYVVLSSPGCGAPISCYFRSGGCLMVCVNPWSQAPAFAFFGMLAGLLPAGVAAALVRRWVRAAGVEVRIVPLPAGLLVLLLALPGVAIFFDVRGVFIGIVALPIAAAVIVACEILRSRGRAQSRLA